MRPKEEPGHRQPAADPPNTLNPREQHRTSLGLPQRACHPKRPKALALPLIARTASASPQQQLAGTTRQQRTRGWPRRRAKRALANLWFQRPAPRSRSSTTTSKQGTLCRALQCPSLSFLCRLRCSRKVLISLQWSWRWLHQHTLFQANAYHPFLMSSLSVRRPRRRAPLQRPPCPQRLRRRAPVGTPHRRAPAGTPSPTERHAPRGPQSALERVACAAYMITPTSTPPKMLPKVTGTRLAVTKLPQFNRATLMPASAMAAA